MFLAFLPILVEVIEGKIMHWKFPEWLRMLRKWESEKSDDYWTNNPREVATFRYLFPKISDFFRDKLTVMLNSFQKKFPNGLDDFQKNFRKRLPELWDDFCDN